MKKFGSRKGGLEFTSNGDGTCYISGIGTCENPYIEIPALHDGERVTGIGELAFYKRGDLTSIVIPDGVTFIGELAFYNCDGLMNIVIPESVTVIGKSAFQFCKSLTSIQFKGTSDQWAAMVKDENWDYDAPLSVIFNFREEKKAKGSKNIPFFRKNFVSGEKKKSKKYFAIPIISLVLIVLVVGMGMALTYKTTPSEMDSMKEATGHESIDLKFVENKSGTCYVSGIGSCKDTDIVIPSEYNGKQVTHILASAFEDCTNLKSITIPDTVTSIGDNAFYGCSALTNITIPDSVTDIGDNAFYGCESLSGTLYENAKYLGNENNPYLILWKAKSISISSCIIHEDTKFIYNTAFFDCDSLMNITIPDGVTSIGSYAFFGCTGLTDITISDSVTSIGEGAFSRCSGLTSVDIPNGVTSIGCEVFANCTGLVSITIPNNVTSIGDNAFLGCIGLTSVTFPNTVTSIGQYAFYNCKNLTMVQYQWTTAKWKTISKGKSWVSNVPATEVICSNGTVALK